MASTLASGATISSSNADGVAPYTYDDGQLSWSGGSSAIKDENIIAVTPAEGSDRRHTIWTLAEKTAPPSNPALEQPPFELRTVSATDLPSGFLEKHIHKALPAYLNPTKTDVHVIISILAGTGLSPAFFDDILLPVLSAIGLEQSNYNVLRTTSEESVLEFARSVLSNRANQGKNQTVLMLSGDGGTVDTINGLLESSERSSTYIKPVIIPLPLGTANALFHSLHKPSSLSSIYIQGLRTLLNGVPHPLPIFQANFSPGARAFSNEGRTATPLVNSRVYGAVVASYGLHASLVADSDTTEYRKHGAQRFGLVAKDLLFPQDGSLPHAYRADVTLFKDGGNVEIKRKEHGYILASLVSNLEKPFTISPASKPLDGQLRVVHFGPLGGERTVAVIKEAYHNGNHVSFDEVGYESISGLRIQFDEAGESWKWRRCCIDGLIVGVEEGGWVEVRTVEAGSEAVDIVVDP